MANEVHLVLMNVRSCACPSKDAYECAQIRKFGFDAACECACHAMPLMVELTGQSRLDGNVVLFPFPRCPRVGETFGWEHSDDVFEITSVDLTKKPPVEARALPDDDDNTDGDLPFIPKQP